VGAGQCIPPAQAADDELNERVATVTQSSSPWTSGDVDEISTARGVAVRPLLGELIVDTTTHDVMIALRGLDTAGDARPITLRNPRGDRAKRALDVLIVALTAPVWLTLLAVLAIAVKCTSRGPAFYRQERLGRGGRAFECVKLRTMRVNADGHLQQLLNSDPSLRNEFSVRFKLRRDPRVTRFGRLLRKSGLDELPQLFSVLSGDMSLVGPRPIVKGEVQFYGPYLTVMQSVRPGLTGLWQVSGRNDIPYPERVAYDVQYVLTRSLCGDLDLITKTLVLAFRPTQRGAY
jgi:lipopolysaccharide/colanic/teichoic acid biosynthesis glycosyltransferase